MAPTVQLSGPTLVTPGSTNAYTLQVTVSGGQNEAGLNVSATAGVLTTGGTNAANTRVMIGAGNRNEIISGVDIALGSVPLSVCPSYDENGDGTVTIDELLTALNFAVGGCPGH